MIDISVVVPFYNAGPELEACVTSVMKQKAVVWEMLLVDDGSKDESVQIAKKYAQNFQNISYICQENRGVSVARNNGVSHAHGQYIYFLDSDDVIKENALSTIVTAADRFESPDIILFGYEMVNDKKHITKSFGQCLKLTGDEFRNRLLEIEKKIDLNSIWNKCYKLSFIQMSNVTFPTGVRIGEDALFNYDLFPMVTTVGILSDVLYSYTMERQGSAMNSDSMDKLFYQFQVIDTFEKMLQDFEIDPVRNIRQKELGLAYQHSFDVADRAQLCIALRKRNCKISTLLYGVISLKDFIKFVLVVFRMRKRRAQ